ncbi:MAG: hypothetical protein WA618_04505, partial [Terriglobales bacterium]
MIFLPVFSRTGFFRLLGNGLLACLIAAPSLLCAQENSAVPLPDLHWRMIGPFRGGRTRAATGVPGQPNVCYIGEVDGGVWKSDD